MGDVAKSRNNVIVAGDDPATNCLTPINRFLFLELTEEWVRVVEKFVGYKRLINEVHGFGWHHNSRKYGNWKVSREIAPSD